MAEASRLAVEADVDPPGPGIPVTGKVEHDEVVILANGDDMEMVQDINKARNTKEGARQVPRHMLEAQYESTTGDTVTMFLDGELSTVQDDTVLEEIAGFEGGNESELPFYSKDVSLEQYGWWELDPSVQQKRFQFRRRSDYPQELADTVGIPDILLELNKNVQCTSMSEWLDTAEELIQKDPNSGLGDLSAPNGKQLERGDRIALFLAGKMLTAIGDADAAIPLYMTWAKAGSNPFITMAVLGGLLYMGCSPSLIGVPLRHRAYLKYLLNWGANPNEPHSDGKTALHFYQTETAVMQMLIEFKADVNMQDSSGDTPLHVAARKGRTAVAEMLLQNGASTDKVNNMNQTAFDVAAAFGHLQICAKCIRRQKEQILSGGKESSQDPEKARPASIAELLSVAKERGTEVDLQLLKQILDSCTIDGKMVLTEPLTDGRLLSDKTSLLCYLSAHPKVFFKLDNHPVLKAFVQAKWKQLARQLLWFRLLFYLFKMVVLTFALAIAARPDLTDDQLNKYPEPLDYFRGVCEAVVLFVTLTKIVDEVVELIRSGWSYFGDRINYVEWLYIVFTLLIIPFRVLNHPGQWIVASLTYFLYGLKIFDFIKLFKLTGAYVQTLRIILSRDILRFMTIFLVSLGIFSGAFYLSLRYDDTVVTPPGSNTTSPGGGVNSDLRKLDGEGTLLYEVYFTGLRSLIEADSVLNYYGPGGSLRALSVIIYLIFLFMVVIVLLNVLIAQVSDTYSKVLSTAEGVYLYHQCRYITSLEGQLRTGVSRKCLHNPLLRKPGWGYVFGCLMFLDIYIVAQLHRLYFRIWGSGKGWLSLPDIIWIGKEPNHGTSRWMTLRRKVARLFSEYAFDEEKNVVVEEVTVNLERKLEREHSKLAAKMDKVLVEETKRLERKVEVDVGKLSKQLEEMKSLLREIAKCTPRYIQSTPEVCGQVRGDAQDEEPG